VEISTDPQDPTFGVLVSANVTILLSTKRLTGLDILQGQSSNRRHSQYLQHSAYITRKSFSEKCAFLTKPSNKIRTVKRNSSC